MKQTPAFAKKNKIMFFAAILLLGAARAAPPPAAELPPLQMGIMPFLSTEQLFRFFTPMRQYLEQKLGRQVVMSTAPDFRTSLSRAIYADYDIYVTAPHFALLLEQENGYRRVARMARLLDAVILVRKNDPVKHIEDLRGRRIASPNKLALISILGEQILRQHGMEARRDYEIQEALSHRNTLIRVSENDADAALTSLGALEHMPPAVRDRLRVLVSMPPLPHLMIMAGPKLAQTEYHAVSDAVLGFTRQGPGKEFFDLTGYMDIATITQTDMDALRPFVILLKERLK